MDRDLRLHLLQACVRDRSFLRTSAHEIAPEDFTEPEEEVIARAALDFYNTYHQPLGALLRSEAEEQGRQKRLGAEGNKRLRALVDIIQQQKLEAVSVAALQDRVHKLKVANFYEKALDQVLEAHEKGELTAQTFAGVVEEAARKLSMNGIISSNYFQPEELVRRIRRRTLEREARKFPRLLIDELDEKVKIIGRGMLAMIVAPFGSGKSLFLLHIAAAYALQGLRVLYITLEDPQDLAENRLDAALTGLPLRRLAYLPNKFKRRFERFAAKVHGRIEIIDASDAGWSVTRFEQAWQAKKQDGFTADAILIDYDDEIVCEKQYKGDSARRFEFAEIYRRLRRLAVTTDSIVWTASQAGRKAEHKRVVRGEDIAEDISKARKCFFAISIGEDPETPGKKHLHIIKHKLDRSKFGFDILTNFDKGVFYDRKATLQMREERRRYLEQQKRQAS